MMPFYNSAWMFKSSDGSTFSPGMYGMTISQLNMPLANMLNELLPTILREHITNEQSRYSSSSYRYMRNNSQLKPLFRPQNFDETLLATYSWKLKFAYDDDKFEAAGSEKGKTSSTSRTGRIAGQLMQSITPPGVVSNTRQIESQAENMSFDTKNFLKQIDEIRAILPDTSSDPNVLKNRLKFEMVCLATQNILNQLVGIQQDGNVTSADTKFVMNRLQEQLAFLGEEEFKITGSQVVIYDVMLPEIIAKIKSTDIDSELDKELARNGMDPSSVQMQKARIKEKIDSWLVEAEKYLDAQNKLIAEGKASSVEKKLDWILDYLEQLAQGEQMTSTNHGGLYQVSHIEILAVQLGNYDVLARILNEKGRKSDVARLDSIIEYAGKKYPFIMSMRYSKDFSGANLLSVGNAGSRLMPLLNMIENDNIFLIPGLLDTTDETAGKETELVDITEFVAARKKRLEVLKEGTEKIKTVIINQLEEQQGKTVSAQMNRFNYFGTDNGLHMLFMGYLDESFSALDKLFAKNEDAESNEDDDNANSTSVNTTVSMSLMGLPVNGNSIPRKKLKKEELALISAVQNDMYESIEYYAQIQKELNLATEKFSSSSKSPSIPQNIRRRGSSVLSENKYYFQRNEIDSYIVQRLMNSRGQSSYYFVFNPFTRVLQHFSMKTVLLDALLTNAETSEGVTAEDITPYCVARWNSWIDGFESKNQDDKQTAECITLFREEENMRRQNASGFDTKKIAEIKKQVETEWNEYKAKLEKASPDDEDAVEPFPAEKLVLLAILAANNNDGVKAVDYLDAISFTNSQDVREREMLILELVTKFPKLKKRASVAIERLKGYQLKETELMTLLNTLQLLGQKNEAERIFNRLMISSNDSSTQSFLLRELNNRDEKDPANIEKAVIFALKVYRSPASNPRNNRNSWPFSHNDSDSPRSLALDILKKYGKLDEITEQLETQLKSSSGSFELNMNLVNTYIKNDRLDDAKNLLTELENLIPTEDEQKITTYVAALRRVGMTAEAFVWQRKIYENNPEYLLNNSWEVVREFNEAGKLDELVEIVKGYDDAVFSRNYYQYANIISSLIEIDSSRKDAQELFDIAWHKGKTPEENFQIRIEMLERTRYNNAPTFNEAIKPHVKEFVLESISVPQSRKKAGNSRGLLGSFLGGSSTTYYPASSNTNPHRVFMRNGNKCRTYSLDVLTNLDDKQLEELREDVRKIIAEHEAVKEKDRDWNRYTFAKVFDIIILLQLKKIEEATEILKVLESDKKTSRPLSECSEIIASKIEEHDPEGSNKEALDVVLKILKNAIAPNPNANDMMGYDSAVNENFVIMLLLRFYKKTDTPEQGRDIAIASLEDIFEKMKECDNNGNIRVGNMHYSLWSLSNKATSLASSLNNAGYGMDVLTVYCRCVNNQPWFVEKLQSENFRNGINDLLSQIKTLQASLSIEDIAKNIDMFMPPIPTGQENVDAIDMSMSSSSMRRMIEGKPVLILLGTYCSGNLGGVTNFGNLVKMRSSSSGNDNAKIVQLDKESVSAQIGSKLLSAFLQIEKEQPEKLVEIQKHLTEAKKYYPGDPSILVALGFCAIAQNNKDSLLDVLDMCEKWVASEETQSEPQDEKPLDDNSETATIAEIQDGEQIVAVEEMEAYVSAGGTPSPFISSGMTLDEFSSDERAKWDPSVYIGLWIIAREVMHNSELKDEKTVKQCEKLARFTSRFVDKKTNITRCCYPHAMSSFDANNDMIFLLDIQMNFPELSVGRQSILSASEIFKQLLTKSPGVLLNDLHGYCNELATRLEDAAKVGYGRDVMVGMQDVFVNRWPKPREDSATLSREMCIDLLFVLDSTLNGCKQNGGDADAIFNSLKTIVMPSSDWTNPATVPFIADYDNLGGRDGFFRSPAINMIDWGIAAEKTDELDNLFNNRKQFIDENKCDNNDPVQMTWNALELYYSLKLQREKRARELVEVFLHQVREEQNADAAKFALIALAPVLENIREQNANQNSDQNADKSQNSFVTANIDLYPLVDAALGFADKGKGFKPYSEYIIREYAPRN
ncbi:MAG: tetratricopeptide repeat protein [Thermoguttaceae bacterium]